MGLLREAYVPPSSLGSNWCLAMDNWHQRKKYYVLFDSSGLENVWEKKVRREKYWIKKHGSLRDALDHEAIEWKLGPNDFVSICQREFMAVCRVYDVNSFPGFWEIKNMAAYNDYGPTMYDLMLMGAPRGILSDRSGLTSEFAGNVYKKYNEIRKDVDIKPLPHGLQHKQHPEDVWFNKSYKIHDDSEYKRLLNNYQIFKQRIQSIYPYAWENRYGEDVDEYWEDAASSTFQSIYGEEVMGGGEDFRW